MSFSEHLLAPLLPTLPPKGKFYLAYSGGLDSHVLLFALSRLKLTTKLLVVHVNHGLSENADKWQAHCQKICEDLGLELIAHKVTINDAQGESLENAARKARYGVFNDLLDKDDYLLMAHHQDDQLETILFRLLRGSGPKGLSAIPQQRALTKGNLSRPLLHFSRQELLNYAQQEKLSWVDDESNTDTRFDRNFLRQEIFPLLKKRWPSFEKGWLRSAQLSHEAELLQTILGKQDLRLARTHAPNRLNIDALMSLELIRQRNVLRVWFAALNDKVGIPLPDHQSLHRIVNEVLPAAEDSQPLVTWSGNGLEVEVRRFGSGLYILKKQNFTAPDSPLCWDIRTNMTLPNNLGTLKLVEVPSDGINLDGIKTLTISFRQGGEEAKPAGRKTRPLKKLFQDYNVPPWLRDKIPLLYLSDELVAVGDLFICDQWQHKKGKKLQKICWEKSDIDCCC